jgi:hypothetical protein
MDSQLMANYRMVPTRLLTRMCSLLHVNTPCSSATVGTPFKPLPLQGQLEGLELLQPQLVESMCSTYVPVNHIFTSSRPRSCVASATWTKLFCSCPSSPLHQPSARSTCSKDQVVVSSNCDLQCHSECKQPLGEPAWTTDR